MDKKKRGSALILAILILSFFMALTMNMYYMAQKKSERAGIKSLGIKSLGEINFGSALGMYEYRLSQWFEQGVTEGIGDTEQADKLYNETTNIVPTPPEDAPVRLSDFSDFFTSEVTRASISITDDAGVERVYPTVDVTLTTSHLSVGGYRLQTPGITRATYLKKIRIVGTEERKGNTKYEIQNMEYNLIYTETITTGSGATVTTVISANAVEINAERITN